MASREDLFTPAAQAVLQELIEDADVASQFTKFLSERESLLALIDQKSSGRLSLVASTTPVAENSLINEVVAQANAMGHAICASDVTSWLSNQGHSLSTLELP